ncbi:MAG: hypothetical protein AB3N15_08920 [Paracoccaceae bacterium]
MLFPGYHKIAGSLLAAALAATLAVPSAKAATVTYGIQIGGAMGMFDAPDSGGLLTSFEITLGGVTYDSLSMGSGAPVYDAASNDIRGNPGTEGFVLNSVAGPGCMAMECVLSLEDSVDPGVIPPQYALFPLVMGVPGTVTNSGSYSVTPPAPIPVPGSVLALASAIALLAALAWRRRPALLHA